MDGYRSITACSNRLAWLRPTGRRASRLRAQRSALARLLLFNLQQHHGSGREGERADQLAEAGVDPVVVPTAPPFAAGYGGHIE